MHAYLKPHTVKHILQNMRTKALLSVAAIAASAITAVAQSNVYSLNIVGYATVPVGANYTLMSNPLSAGVTNGANEIGLQIQGALLLTWNGASFTTVSYDSTVGGWFDPGTFAAAAPPSLPPGKGFFYYLGYATNVTFVGQVVPGPSSTNTLSLPVGYSLVGSPLPAAVADITAAPVGLPTVQNQLVLTWTGSAYVQSAYDPTVGGWYDPGTFLPKSAPSYAIGQGFFYYNPNPSAAIAWSQSLP